MDNNDIDTIKLVMIFLSSVYKDRPPFTIKNIPSIYDICIANFNSHTNKAL